jgi:NAD(P)-dependent dehydrogenase (short-subunit alcohol dehydrogenase family)
MICTSASFARHDRAVELGLSGKVAVVTGASRGIGRAVVDELVREGVAVVAGARDVSALAGLAGVTGVACDLATPAAPARLVEEALARHGGVDLLVNNVAVAKIQLGGFASIGDDDWQRAFDVNVLAAVRAVRAALPSLRERRGAIVNVSSLNARSPAVEAPEYSATKAALASISRGLALELASAGVRVNTVSPGPIATDLQSGPGGIGEVVAGATGGSVEGYLDRARQGIPLGRLGDPSEVAAVVVALLSDRLGFVTGADVAVDGAKVSA